MARKKKHPEHVNHERWLVSYADFITLLFAFFVVMFAASNTDKKKAGQVAHSVQSAFSELGIFSPAGKVIPLSEDGVVPTTAKMVIGDLKNSISSAQSAKPRSISELKTQIESDLKEQVENKSIRISQSERGLTISLSEAGFFNPGSEVMQPKGTAVLDKIVEHLLSLPNPVRIEGHTDNTPIHTAQFPSNWELSTARATHVLHYLIDSKVSPLRLSPAGYGENWPVASNETAEGRAANRRVDLVILSDSSQKLEPK